MNGPKELREDLHDGPRTRRTDPAGRRPFHCLDLYGVWILQAMVLVGAIGGPLIVYFLTIGRSLWSDEQKVTLLSGRWSKSTIGLPRWISEPRTSNIGWRTSSSLSTELRILSVVTLDQKVDRIIFTLARTGTDIGFAAISNDKQEPAE